MYSSLFVIITPVKSALQLASRESIYNKRERERERESFILPSGKTGGGREVSPLARCQLGEMGEK